MVNKKFLAVLCICYSFASTAHAAQGRQFFMSVVYGTLAGTLVGAATLAFTSNPGDNLNNVARGASYGMYAGILLGLYVTYLVDDEEPSNSGVPQSFLKQESKDGFKVTMTPYFFPEMNGNRKDIRVGAEIFTYRF